MKNAKLIGLFCSLLIFAFLAGGCALFSSVGVLDLNKIMTDSQKVKDLQGQLNQKGEELSKKLESDKPGLTAEQYDAKKMDAMREFAKTKDDLEKQIDDSVKQATEQVAKEKRMNTIIYKNGVAYGGTDVTQDVINKMQ